LCCNRKIDAVALRRLWSIRRGRLAVRDCLELLQKLVGHEVDGREEVDNALENADSITDMHPFHAIEA
jgi:hypothetical protein